MPPAFDRQLSPKRPKRTSGRTAIILRGWSTFEFKEQDLLHIRALITEASLASGGRYTVILLVDVKGGDLDVFGNPADYQTVLDSIPPEFRNMTVLFDQRHFLRAWYPKVSEWRPEWQIEQPRKQTKCSPMQE